MFDYIFYRLYCFYRKKEKGIGPISTSVMYLSFLQLLIVFCIMMTVNITLQGALTKDLTDQFKNLLKIGIVAFILLLDLINYLIYKHRYKKLLEKFKNHPFNRRFKIWMLYILGAGLFTLPFLYMAILKML